MMKVRKNAVISYSLLRRILLSATLKYPWKPSIETVHEVLNKLNLWLIPLCIFSYN